MEVCIIVVAVVNEFKILYETQLNTNDRESTWSCNTHYLYTDYLGIILLKHTILALALQLRVVCTTPYRQSLTISTMVQVFSW